MKKTFSARRVPRKVGHDEEELVSDQNEQEISAEPTIVRPTSKARKGSSLRRTFRPGGSEDEEEPGSGVTTPKRSNISRVAAQRNAAQRSSLLSTDAPRTQSSDDADGPAYSAEYLKELKESTPNTPHDLTTDFTISDVDDVASDTQALDISSKFGSSLARYQQQQTSAIPSATEIAEKKARRARLALEQNAEEFISLNPSDPELDEDEDENVTRDEQGRLILKPKDKHDDGNGRLVRDDKDIMEDFDEFTEAEGQILFGRKAEDEAARKRKAEMAAQIAEAEGASDSDSNASERERNDAFEAVQTKHGTYSTNHTSNDPYSASKPKTPPKISPLPTLDGVLERLRKQVADLQSSRMQKLQEMEALQREKIRLGEEEIRIQRALRETSEKFQQLRAEKGVEAATENVGLIGGPESSDLSVRLNGDGGPDQERNGASARHLGLGMAERGLESLATSGGGTPMDTDSQEELDVRPGLGS